MNAELLAMLQQWPATRHGADVRRVHNPASFSGAEIYRVAADGREFALRRWPIAMVRRRLTKEVHFLQSRLVEKGFEAVPRVEQTVDGATCVADERERLWELASWRPGEPDLSASPPVKRVRAALRMLAAIHLAARFDRPAQLGPSPSMRERAERIDKFMGSAMHQIAPRANNRGDSEQELLHRAFWAAFHHSFEQRRAAADFANVPLPIQPRLGDARREHFLFTGDQVTGVIDFGAADVDAPAGDVARLLGGLAGDDRELWAVGIAAYETVVQLSDDERRAIGVFDATGLVVSVMSWLRWLFVGQGPNRPAADRQPGLARLAELTARLENVADG